MVSRTATAGSSAARTSTAILCEPGRLLLSGRGELGTLFAVYQAIQKQKPLFERVVTVTGLVRNPMNVTARIGTLLREPVRVRGAGRTDAGVHACGQVASVPVRRLPDDLRRLLRGVNALLPEEQ